MKSKGKEITSPAAYRVLYRLLRKAVIAKVFGGTLPSDIPEDSPKLWDDKMVKSQYKELLGGSHAINTQYFHIKLNRLNVGGRESFDPMALTKALLLIGVDLGSDRYKENDWLTKANFLWARFEEDYKADIEAEEHKNAPSSRNSNTPAETTQNTQIVNNPNFDRVSQIIVAFYQFISSERYSLAWKLLTSDFQQRVWNKEFDRFKDGYTNTHQIINVEVLAHHQDHPNLISCLVIYEEHGAAWSSQLLPFSLDMKIKDLELFCQNVAKLGKLLEENGFNNVNDTIELHKLFEVNAADYIAFRCGFPLSKLSTIFETPRPYTVKRAFQCTCKNEAGEWYLHRLVGMKIDNLR